MKRQISAGAVIFRREEGGAIKFLLLYHGKNYWNFPKGQLEVGERVPAAFLREVREETGLGERDLKILSDFRATDRYTFLASYPRSGIDAPSQPRPRGRQPISKTVILYLVEAKKRAIAVSEEHEGFAWFTYNEALRVARYQNTRDILKKANEFIRKSASRRPAHPQRKSRHLRRHRTGHRPAAGMARGREHTA